MHDSKRQTEEIHFGTIRENCQARMNIESHGTWESLKKHKARHLEEGRGFGFGLVDNNKPTRTLSADILRMGQKY